MDYLYYYYDCIIQSQGFIYKLFCCVLTYITPFTLVFPCISYLSKTELSMLTTTPTSASHQQSPASYGNSILLISQAKQLGLILRLTSLMFYIQTSRQSYLLQNMSRILSFSPSPWQPFQHPLLPQLWKQPPSWSPCFCSHPIQCILNTEARVILLKLKSDHLPPLIETI